MLALAIIATVILGFLILISFATAVTDYDALGPFLVIMAFLGFVIMTIWILYAR